MSRWEPDARGRFGEAALELYAERGFEQVTVAEIAERAGLTARTFFRYFSDKREVLFSGSDTLRETLATAVVAAPATDGPLAAVATALNAVAEVIGTDHAHTRRRHSIIVANADLRERERTKVASWSGVLADGLRARGVGEPTSSLAAETGVAVFRVAFENWAVGPGKQTLMAALDDSFRQLRDVAGSA